MVELAPLDILGTTFNRRFKGYDPEEVQRFLAALASAMEDLLRERGELKQLLFRREQELAAFRERDGALQDALVAAQRSAEQTLGAARAEGQRLVDEAQGLADRLVEEAHQRVQTIESTIADLRSHRREVRAELMRLTELVQGLIHDDQQIEREESTSPRLALLQRRKATRESEGQA